MIGTDGLFTGFRDIVGLLAPLAVVVGSLQPSTGTDLGMVYLTFLEYNVIVARKQRGIGPVTEEATSLEHHVFAAIIGNQLIFAVTEEVTLIELHTI